MTNLQRRGYRDILTEFISIYRSQPCIWQIKHPDYHNREKKANAYKKLVEQLRAIEPSANREMVVRKINGLRTNYRKEKKKIEDSIRNGSSPDDVYEPTLWYFDQMKFLDEDQDTPKPRSVDGYESFEEAASDSMERDSIGSDGDDNVETASTSALTPRQRPRSRKRKSGYSSESIIWPNDIQSVNQQFKLVNDDRFDIFGKNVAVKLRDLPKQQRLIAEKIINETLFQAEMGILTLSKRE